MEFGNGCRHHDAGWHCLITGYSTIIIISVVKTMLLLQYGPGIFVNDVVSFLGRMRIVMPYTPVAPMNARTIHKAYCSNRAVQIFQYFFQFSHVDQVRSGL